MGGYHIMVPIDDVRVYNSQSQIWLDSLRGFIWQDNANTPIEITITGRANALLQPIPPLRIDYRNVIPGTTPSNPNTEFVLFNQIVLTQNNTKYLFRSV